MTRKSSLIALAAAILAAAAPKGARADVAGWHKGMTFASWWYNAYTQPSTITSLDQLANLKGNWIAIVPHWHMATRTSTTIYPETTGGTATDESVRYIIQQAHSRGLKVMLKPHVDPRDGAWRGSIAPSDVSAWFQSYRNFIVHYAQLATETGVEMLCVGVEYKSMSGSANTQYWRSIVADVRNAYKGPLTYAANWGPRSWGEYYGVQWWDALDYIGVDAYFPITRANYPTVEQAKAGWYSYTDANGSTNRWVDDMKALSTKYGKKVLFTELGFNTVVNPGAEWEIQTGTDQNGAKNCAEATFQVFDGEPWMAGIFWWTWSVNPSDGGSSDRGMNINNKPIGPTIASWYGRSGGDTTPPATPCGINAQATNSTSATVWWYPTSDNVGVAGYRIYRDGTPVLKVTEAWGTDTGLSPGSRHTYRVSAFDAAGNESAPSTAITVQVLGASSDTQAPAAPGAMQAAALSTNSVVVWWLPASDNVGVAAYNVYRNGLKVATVSPTQHTDTGLTAGTTYSYKVTAVDAAGNEGGACGPFNVATAPPGTLMGYDFEDGTVQGWFGHRAGTGVWSSGSVKYQGSRSLALYADAASISNEAYAFVSASAAVAPGQTMTGRVYLKGGNTNVLARAVIEDGAQRWATGAWIALKPYTWMPVAITVPAGAATPLRQLGFQFVTTSGTFTGYVHIDDVRWR